jgi:hypothetical protein
MAAFSTGVVKQQVTAEELLARAEANSYKGAHRKEDNARDKMKHNKKTKQSQNAMLNRYIL